MNLVAEQRRKLCLEDEADLASTQVGVDRSRLSDRSRVIDLGNSVPEVRGINHQRSSFLNRGALGPL